MDDIVYSIGASSSTSESSGGSSVSINADYKNPGDFSVTRRDENTLGLSLITTPVRGVRSIDFVYLKILRADGSIELIVNGVDDSFTYVPGDPTTSGELSFTSTVLLETDTAYEIGVNGATSSVESLAAIEADVEAVNTTLGTTNTKLDSVITATGTTIPNSLTTLQTKTSLSGISMPANYFSPADFAVTFLTGTTLTVSGAPFTVNDGNCFVLSVMVKASTGVWTKYVNGANGVSLKADTDNVITIADAGVAPFAQTDLAYRVAINYQQKAFDPSTNTMMVIEQTPNRAAYVADTIDITTAASGTAYYPSSSGLSMDGYKDLSISGFITESEAVTDTLTVEVTNGESIADAQWIPIYGYDPQNNTMVNSISRVNSGTTFFALDFDNLNFTYVRLKLVSGDNSNTASFRIRRKA